MTGDVKICVECNKAFIESHGKKYCSYDCRKISLKKKVIKRVISINKQRWQQINCRAKKSNVKCLSWNEYQLLININKNCEYCNISENNLPVLKLKPKYLTMDKKNPNGDYTLDNVCLACMRCNMLKGNVLSYDEMKEIGEKYLKPKWERLLQKRS